jgi:transposase
MKKHTIQLSQEQHQALEALISKGQAPARKITHAQVLLKSAEGSWTDQEISEAFGVSEATMWRVRQRFVEHGLEDALNRRRQPERPQKRKLTGEREAHLLAVTCSAAPAGQQRWSIRLLTKTLMQLEIVEQVGRETIRQTLKKNELKPWLKKQWCIPPKANAEFVSHMEEVLAVYHRPYDERFPQVCLDEGCKQLLSDTQERLPMQPGKSECYDYEYEREGMCSIFLACEPLAGRRFLQVSPQRTRRDWAHFVKELIDVHYPQAEKIVLVMDNLNTHTPASFYEAFEPEEAWRLAQKLEIHYTPTHGSWLNMAEIELSVLARQGLSERMKSLDMVRREVQAWQRQRDQAQMTINWRFTTADARIKLKRLYPSFN